MNKAEVEELKKASTIDAGKTFKKISLQPKNIHVLNMNNDWRLICIQEISNDMSAVLIESKKDFTLRFLRCFFEKSDGDPVLKLI